MTLAVTSRREPYHRFFKTDKTGTILVPLA